MTFEQLLADYSEVLPNIIINFAREDMIYNHDNWKKTRAKRTIGSRELGIL